MQHLVEWILKCFTHNCTLCLMFVFCIICGCTNSGVLVPVETKPQEKELGSINTSANLQRFHFGNVLPGTSNLHVFSLKNDSKRSWKIKTFHTSCACTVASASKIEIRPGDETNIEIKYKAPNKPVDDVRRIGVQLEHEETPGHWLEIQAKSLLKNPT